MSTVKPGLIALDWVTKNVPAIPKTVPCGPSGHCGILVRPLVAVEENLEIENAVDEVRIILRFNSIVNQLLE